MNNYRAVQLIECKQHVSESEPTEIGIKGELSVFIDTLSVLSRFNLKMKCLLLVAFLGAASASVIVQPAQLAVASTGTSSQFRTQDVSN